MTDGDEEEPMSGASLRKMYTEADFVRIEWKGCSVAAEADMPV